MTTMTTYRAVPTVARGAAFNNLAQRAADDINYRCAGNGNSASEQAILDEISSCDPDIAANLRVESETVETQ